MTDRFYIEADPLRSLLRIRMTGFWSSADVLDFIIAEQSAASELPCRKGEHLVLADLSDFKLQSQATVGLFQDFIRSPEVRSKRLALVGGQGLAWIQIKRMMVRDSIAAFDDRSLAEQWLYSGDPSLVVCVERSLGQKAAAAAATIQLRA